MENVKPLDTGLEREKLSKLQEAIGGYSEKGINSLSERILEKFTSGKFDMPEPDGYSHSGVVFRNFCYAFTFKAPEERDELNYTMWGLAIRKAMDTNPEFDKYVRDYIRKAQKADSEAWAKSVETYNKYLEYDKKSNPEASPRTQLLDQNDDHYTQGKIMAKFILGEI
jgi:hypothetical protein